MTDRAQVAALQRLIERLRRRIAFVEGSRFWTMRAVWLRCARVFGIEPADEAPPIPAREIAEAMDALDPYTRWLLENEPRPVDLARLAEAGRALAYVPKIGLIIDDAGEDAARAIDAAHAQCYAATVVVRTSEVAPYPRRFERLNAAFAACPADIVAFCDARTSLAPHAAFEIALAFNLDPQAIAAYGDRDVLWDDGRRSDPVFAPDWSPETFLSTMYTGPVVFYRREAVERHGGFDGGSGDALHYDLALRVLGPNDRVAHRAAVLVHGPPPQAAPSRAAASDEDRAVGAELARRGLAGSVEASGCDGVRVVRYADATVEPVDVIVPTRDLAAKLERCLESVFRRNARSDVRVLVVDDGSAEAETARLLATYLEREGDRFAVLRIDEPFNFSRLVNAAARVTNAPYLLLLNNDAAFVSEDGIAALLEHARRPGIGAVGARLLYEDGALQHAGVVVGIGGLAGHVYRGVSPDFAAAHAAIAGIRNYAAVTGACLMVRRASFEAVNGFDERLAVEFNDIDFCLKLRELGLRNVYLPHVILRHDESSSRGRARSPDVRERELFRRRWRSDTFRDPYYNANLTLEREDASLAF